MTVATYAQIAEDLRGQIRSRDIEPGGQLPSVIELRDRYKASRNTVLDAIKKLKDEGLVETRPGQGWFARVRIVPFVNSLDWGDAAAIEQASASGRAPSFTPPAVSRRPAPRDMAERLDVPVGTPMIVRRQEWFLDDMPWKLQDVWCPRSLADQGADKLLIAEDLPQGLGTYLHGTLGVRPASAAFFFLPRRPSDDERRFFRFPAEGEAPYVVEIIRTAIMAAESGPRPLYAVVGVYAGDRNRFEGSRLALPAE